MECGLSSAAGDPVVLRCTALVLSPISWSAACAPGGVAGTSLRLCAAGDQKVEMGASAARERSSRVPPPGGAVRSAVSRRRPAPTRRLKLRPKTAPALAVARLRSRRPSRAGRSSPARGKLRGEVAGPRGHRSRPRGRVAGARSTLLRVPNRRLSSSTFVISTRRECRR